MAGLKNIVGGELKGYTELLHDSRNQAISRMVEQAEQLGANAVVNVRFFYVFRSPRRSRNFMYTEQLSDLPEAY